MSTPKVTTAATSLSRLERIKLLVHRTLDKRLSPIGVWVMRRTRGRVTEAWKVNALLLTTRGRRSGRQRTVVLQYFPDGDDMIVVAANDGGESHPGWYFNLVDTPTAAVEVNGKTIRVDASELQQSEAARWWRRILEIAPAYENYRRATARAFPIFRLTRTQTIQAPGV